MCSWIKSSQLLRSEVLVFGSVYTALISDHDLSLSLGSISDYVSPFSISILTTTVKSKPN